MGETTLIYLSRVMALHRKLETLAQNVANAETTGFRAHQLSFHEYLKSEKGFGDSGKKERPSSLVAPHLQTVSYSQGSLQATGNPLDVGIDGEGYLVIQTDAGERYTRNGSLTVNGDGRLATLDGQLVLGKNGPISVPANEGQITIAFDGTISSAKAVLGQLRLVRFENPHALQSVGSGLLSSNEPPSDAAPISARIISGFLEKSNMDITREMANLSEIVRSYEMVARLLQKSQDADDINKLGSVPD
ncbi:MAG: flagellar basal-body rod protein FlgF [Bradyrhizobium sp.]|uniref:flagellar basal-body rod protein FlgF n=1 Tax=Bradyrhizobium sp. TaxID=376 RepID=UPI001A182D22|nr:flagellar basal-body rod protein FlgF [Bradyrhizobium sp.]MBJ7401901.1 flagellar basal-body rod protein FlgF [Bradyrhizobium sp.]